MNSQQEEKLKLLASELALDIGQTHLNFIENKDFPSIYNNLA